MVSRVADQWASLWPALAFLLFGVPLAALLDRLGFFEAVAALVAGRRGRDAPVLSLWLLAFATTVVLNLDTTIVLLTPLYLRLAQRARTDPIALAVIPLLLASFASSVLPVSNLTNLIVTERLHVPVGEFLTHLAVPSVVASFVGWLLYRRRYPTRLANPAIGEPDRFALVVGGCVVAALLAGFSVGPSFGIAPWMTAAAADLALILVTRVVPWREVPLSTAVVIAGLAALVAVVVPSDTFNHVLAQEHPIALVAIAGGAVAAANLVNNLPALLVALGGLHQMSWGIWAWLLGVNIGAALLPVGALANLLWLRIVRGEGHQIGFRQYAAITIPIAVPAFAAAALVLAMERLLLG